MSDEMSLALTRRIENLFAKEYVGGEVQRRAAIQCAINEVISADLAAERERADKAVMELKQHMPISKYNGLGIEEWKAQADALRELLREARWANNEASASKRADIYARIDAALNPKE